MVEQRQNRAGVNIPRGPRPPSPRPDTALTPKDIIGMLRRHVLLIVLMTLLGFAIGGVSWYLLLKYLPKYTAQTYIRVLSFIEKDPMAIGGAVPNKDIQYGYRYSMANLIRRQSTLQELLQIRAVQETKWFRRHAKFDEQENITNINQCLEKAYEDLDDDFGVSAQRDGEFIVVSMTCGDAKDAQTIVNEMVDLFVGSQTITRKGEVSDKLTKLEDQRLRVQRDLDAANRGLDDVRLAYGFSDLEEHRFEDVITQKLKDLDDEQNTLLVEMGRIQALTANLQKLVETPIAEQVEQQLESDPVVVALTRQLSLLESSLAGSFTKFGENHKVVRETQELLNKVRQELEKRRQTIGEINRQANFRNAQDQLVVLQSQMAGVENTRQAAEAQKKELDTARVLYQQRLSIRDQTQDSLDAVKEQVNVIHILLEDPETPKVQKVGAAPEPMDVSSPRWEFYFPGGFVLGLMLGVGLAFLIEVLNDLVRTPRDVARHLFIPLLGVIPDADEDHHLRSVEPCHVVRQAPYSIISESYRRFRSNLRLSDAGASSKILLVSSGAAGDGKTSVAVNLAFTFIAENKKILLIDANFWRPKLHTVFPKTSGQDDTAAEQNEQSEFGLSTLLSGLCGYQQAIRPTGIEGLSLIDSGLLPPNPAELLAGEQMAQLIKHQRENYDYVIVDGPPVLLVSDVKILARLVDGTVLVFNADTTKRGAALRTIRELKEIKAPIIGCVLLAVRAMKGGYFHEQFKSYQKYSELQLAHAV